MATLDTRGDVIRSRSDRTDRPVAATRPCPASPRPRMLDAMPGLALLPLAATLLGAAPAPPTVAVLYFDYQGKDEQMGLLRKGLAQMLISDLTGPDSYRLVERDRLQDLLTELDLNKSRKIDRKTANRLGKLLGARYMVLGGYFDVLGTLRVDARVVRVETGEVVGSVGANGKPDDFLALEQKLAEDLSAILGEKLTTAKASRRRKPRAKPPKKLKAKTALRYAKALDAKDKGDAETAKKEMKKVLEEQPDFALAQLDLAALMQ